MFTQVNKWKINILSRSRLLCTTYLCVGGCCNLHNNVIVPDHFLWWMWVVTIHHLFSVFIIIQQSRGSKNTIQWNARILFLEKKNELNFNFNLNFYYNMRYFRHVLFYCFPFIWIIMKYNTFGLESSSSWS